MSTCIFFKENIDIVFVWVYNVVQERDNEMAKSKNETKSELISVRFYPSEVRKIEKFSKMLKMSLPDYVRYAINIDFDKSTAQQLEKKKRDYEKLMTTAKKAIYLVEKLSKIVNFQLDTGLPDEVIRKIKGKFFEIEKEKKVLKDGKRA